MCRRRNEGPAFTKGPDRWERGRWKNRASRAIEAFWHGHNRPGTKLLHWLYERGFFGNVHPYLGGTRWEWPWQPRTCSFCGGVNGDDAARLIAEGWTVHGTGKSYKAYMEPPNRWGPVPPVKLYYSHPLPEEK